MKREQFDEITTLSVNRFGEIAIATEGPKSMCFVHRETGEQIRRFGESNVVLKKLAIDSEDNLYALDRGGNSITIMDRWGGRRGAINGSSYGVKRIADFHLDLFDNIYLLGDKDKFLILEGIGRSDGHRLALLLSQAIQDDEAKPAKDLRAITVSRDGSTFVATKKSPLAFQ